MNNLTDYTELVERARLGDRESMNALVEGVRGRLYTYVYRIVLRDDLAQDIVQETLLEMFKVLGKLKNTDSFWPWLRAIAFNKIRRHHTNEKKHRTAAEARHVNTPEALVESGLTDLVTDELKRLVVGAMTELRPSHRKVLTMRCYEDMEYADIADLMDCSELSARVLFCRAKRSLERSLSSRGFKRSFVLTALIIFGKVTAPSQAAATTISITAATTATGLTAAVIAAASTKAAIVSIAAAGVITAGSVMVANGPDTTALSPNLDPTVTDHIFANAAENSEESWYYYPLATEGPVLMRHVRLEDNASQSYTQWWQDSHANYYYDRTTNTININNNRTYNQDLSVLRLPTDNVNLADFISLVEGRSSGMQYVSDTGAGLLVIADKSIDADENGAKILRHYNILDEEYFKYQWPAGAARHDNRDEMHKQRWTYFRISGNIGGNRVTGTGRIPFVYSAANKHFPWIKLKIENSYQILDDGSRARLFNEADELLAVYGGGTFLAGLSRPWMGLHTIDTVRRDAAAQRVWFKTEHSSDKRRSQVTLTCGDTTITYSIDLEKDIIESIKFTPTNDQSAALGELHFSYGQEAIDAANISSPRRSGSGQPQRDRPPTMWLAELANGTLAAD